MDGHRPLEGKLWGQRIPIHFPGSSRKATALKFSETDQASSVKDSSFKVLISPSMRQFACYKHFPTILTLGSTRRALFLTSRVFARFCRYSGNFVRVFTHVHPKNDHSSWEEHHFFGGCIVDRQKAWVARPLVNLWTLVWICCLTAWHGFYLATLRKNTDEVGIIQSDTIVCFLHKVLAPFWRSQEHGAWIDQK